MKHLLCTLSITLLFILQMQAQKNLSYNWHTAEYSLCSDENKTENEIIIFENRIVEYYFHPTTNKLHQLTVLHKKIQVNSDDAISGYNKLYLPSTNANRVLENYKARVISKDGKIHELNKLAVKKAKDEESNKEYTYFAFEGVEKGSQIEFFYCITQSPEYKGSTFIYQSDVAKEQITFKLISPKHLTFTFKAINNASTPEIDTSISDVNVYSFVENNIQKVKNEPWSMYKTNLKQILYKIHTNTFNNTGSLVNYDDVAQFVHNNIYINLSKQDKKALEKLIKQANILQNDTTEEKIYKLEHYLKKNIAITTNYTPQGDEISKSLQQKIATETALLRIYANTCLMFGIEHQIVLTSDRNRQKFDATFESYDFLEHYLLYIPSINKYLDPTALYYRLGLIPFEYTWNYGLFIKPASAKNATHSTSEVSFIDTPSKETTYDKKQVEVFFSELLESNTILLKKEMFGYYANSYQPYFEIVNNTVKKQLQEQIVRYISPKATITEMSFSNDRSDCIAKKPLICNARLVTSEFIEKAGNKILFRVGDLIGPQVEMYRENERKLPIENDFNRLYQRTLTIHIPDGYSVENIEDIQISKTIIDDDGIVSALFVSDYNIVNNTIIINVEEWYNQIYYPVEQFEEFRSIINAAADFNKIVFVLNKN